MDYAVSFGKINASKPVPPGPAFRLAVLGDFSGRANAGILETGEKLAARKPRPIDVDNLDQTLESLNLSIQVPTDDAGGTISVPIRCMDDFHPDQLVENVPVLQELVQLRRSMGSKAGFDKAAKTVLSWSGEEALPRPSRKARGSKIATDRRLSDFARLTGRKPTEEADAGDLIKRLVGPFIVPARDSRQDLIVARLDAAMSDAMRRILHHPDFQTAEALWRGLEMLTRRIETGAKMRIVVYDISAEELAADLASAQDLKDTGLYSLFVEKPGMDTAQGALSFLAALYEFEVTPPHAELLGRMAQIAAAAGAPFVASIGPDYLKTPIHDWHPLIKEAWDALRGLRASAYLALNTPRFLMRMPYGKRTDPIDAFAFEEFTRQGGLSGMLWGHPALLTANVLAETWLRNPKAPEIGSIATVDEMPVYVFHDTDGEQIALPCTERQFTERQIPLVTTAGINPVVSIRGRPEVRVAGFASLAGGTIAGSWASVDVSSPAKPAAAAPARPAAKQTEEPDDAEETAKAETEAASAEESNSELDALLANLGSSSDTPAETPAETLAETSGESSEAEAPAAAGEGGGDDLDALLASLNTNAEPEPAAEEETEADLDALLASLK